ncbi:MAG: hydrogen gas-evolving membrane-bound hydrogenase subunit E [Anaerolineae bacterium]
MGIAVLSMTPALAALLMPRKLPRTLQAWLLAALVSVLFLWLLTYLPLVSDQGHFEISVPWVPELGLTLSIYLDGLSLLFGLIITGIGAAIIIYTAYYFEDIAERGRFYSLLLGFMSAMLALVLAGNILTLFIAWELTSILSFLLISFKSEKEDARSGALQALVITGGGGLALFVGLMLLGTAAGTTQISELLTNDTLRTHPWYAAFTILILIGCFSKSAQFPLHFWLPGAMSAPTPASAYLHSATMVKAGIYLMARLYPVLGDTPLWQNTLLVVGLATMAVGATLALRQRDLKAALAYSTISQLGALTALCALPEAEGIKALLIGVIAHSLYKATLFLMTGAVDHTTGTRNLDELGGLRKQMPGWALVAIVAGLSMAGFPPLLGFVAKETLLDAMLTSPGALVIVVYSAVLTVTMAVTMVAEVFFGKSPFETDDHHHHLHAVPQAMLLGPAALALGSILTGVQLDTLVTPVIDPSIHHEFHLALFAGFNIPFFLSLVAFPGGLMLFATRPIWIKAQTPPLPNAAAIYRRIVAGVEGFASILLRSQGGKIRYYLIVILAAATLLMATAGLSHLAGRSLTFTIDGGADLLKIVLLVFALGAMLASILFKRHLLAALALGLSGYCIGGVFLLEPAPDVALVQFLVETIGTVLLIVMLAKISPSARKQAMENLWSSSRAGVLRDIIISTAVGIGMTVFALAAVLNRPETQTITIWHMEHALPYIGIPDIVGAIVTDFRGMDTVIEISVFGMAALGVLTLLTTPDHSPAWPLRDLGSLNRLRLRILRVKDSTSEESHVLHPDVQEGEDESHGSRLSTPLTRVIAKIVLPFALLLAFAQLFYGGDGPGDGFTAGVTSGLGVALWYIVFGYHESRERLRWLRPRRLIGAGILLVVVNAAAPLLFGQPFLAHIPFEIPLPANLHLSTTFLFETGIFLTVFGSSSMVLEAIAHPKEIEPQ